MLKATYSFDEKLATQNASSGCRGRRIDIEELMENEGRNDAFLPSSVLRGQYNSLMNLFAHVTHDGAGNRQVEHSMEPGSRIDHLGDHVDTHRDRSDTTGNLRLI